MCRLAFHEALCLAFAVENLLSISFHNRACLSCHRAFVLIGSLSRGQT